MREKMKENGGGWWAGRGNLGIMSLSFHADDNNNKNGRKTNLYYP